MPQWTPEQARAFARKGADALKRKAEERRRLRENPPPPITANPTALPAQDPYAGDMLNRVRKDINGIAERLRESVKAEILDAQKIDRLASAWSRLAELERQYACRPLPGTLKPASRPTRAQPEPDAEPVPIVASTPQ